MAKAVKKAQDKSVIVYSTEQCPWCHRAKDFLRAHNVEFEDVNVSEDQDRAREMVEKSGQMGVPVIEIGDVIIVGFNEAAIRRELNLPEKD